MSIRFRSERKNVQQLLSILFFILLTVSDSRLSPQLMAQQLLSILFIFSC